MTATTMTEPTTNATKPKPVWIVTVQCPLSDSAPHPIRETIWHGVFTTEASARRNGKRHADRLTRNAKLGGEADPRATFRLTPSYLHQGA